MNAIFIYKDYTKETFENIHSFEEKRLGVSFYDETNDYWFIKYEAFLSFILSEVNKNDT